MVPSSPMSVPICNVAGPMYALAHRSASDPRSYVSFKSGPRFPGSSCGPEGDPNNFPNEFSGQSIEGACQNHDKCYADCSKSKSQCDTQFYHDIRRACFNDGSAVACNLASLGYYAAVALKGRDAFDKARENCDTCSSKQH